LDKKIVRKPVFLGGLVLEALNSYDEATPSRSEKYKCEARVLLFCSWLLIGSIVERRVRRWS